MWRGKLGTGPGPVVMGHILGTKGFRGITKNTLMLHMQYARLHTLLASSGGADRGGRAELTAEPFEANFSVITLNNQPEFVINFSIRLR